MIPGMASEVVTRQVQLVGGLVAIFDFHILGIIIPIDKYFSGVQTTNQTVLVKLDGVIPPFFPGVRRSTMRAARRKG